MEKKKVVSKIVTIQSVIPRSLFVELKRECAETGYTIKEIMKHMLEERYKEEKFEQKVWKVSDEDYNKAMLAIKTYYTIRNKVEKENEK